LWVERRADNVPQDLSHLTCATGKPKPDEAKKIFRSGSVGTLMTDLYLQLWDVQLNIGKYLRFYILVPILKAWCRN
jgi:hypothetical protein